MPIHLDEEIARDAGLPGIIAHGLCTMAFTSWAVLTEVAGSDVSRLDGSRCASPRWCCPATTSRPGSSRKTRTNGVTTYAFETARGGRPRHHRRPGRDRQLDHKGELDHGIARRPHRGHHRRGPRDRARTRTAVRQGRREASSSTTWAGPTPARAPTTGPRTTSSPRSSTAGGAAVANTENVATWDGAKSIVQQAIDEFGGLDVLVNNAGILRDASSRRWTRRNGMPSSACT